MVILNYIKYKPEFVNLTLIQSDISLYDKENLYESEIPRMNDFNIFTVKTKKYAKNNIINMLFSFYKNKEILNIYHQSKI